MNLRIADFLYELATYEQTVTQQKFKANAYRKAAAAIAKHDVEISSGEQAQKMDGVGKKIAEKIDRNDVFAFAMTCKQLREAQQVAGRKLETNLGRRERVECEGLATSSCCQTSQWTRSRNI